MITSTPCELLEERLAALHTASLQLVQDISLPSLLQRIAVLACEQTRARYGAVSVLDEDGKITQFYPIGMDSTGMNGLTQPQGLGLIGELMRSSESIRLANLQNDPRSVGFPPGHPHMTAFLGVPIRMNMQTLGQIYLTDPINGGTFSADDQSVIETLAAYAGAAISNAHLYEQIYHQEQSLVRRTENLALLNLLASTLASSTNIDQILESALSQVMDYLHVGTGEIFLRQEESDLFKSMILRTPPGKNLWKKDQYKFGEGVIGRTAQSNQVAIFNCNSIPQDVENICDQFYQVACFPLTSLRGTVGVLSVAVRDPEPLEDIEIQFMTAISAWVGTVIDNIRLSIQQRRLAVLEERERIGMDLHDGIIQSIYGVGLTLEHVRLLLKDDPVSVPGRIEQAINDLNNTIRDIRAYILDLRPRQLHEENLLQGIQRLTNEFRVNSLVEVSLQGSIEDLQDLPDAQAIALFHICQESLANIAKHARAHKVEVSVWTSADRALLEVSDDGRGFALDQARVTLGHGLANMQTRAHNSGGDVEITSEPGAGTTILAWVPFTRNDITNESLPA
jgi:two-component system, NarL family, sensor histidine kinase DevS